MIKRISILSLLLCSVSLGMSQQSAQDQSWTVLSNSASMVQLAQSLYKGNEAKIIGLKMKGNLAKAVNQYHYAQELHQSGNYYSSIHHSRHAWSLSASIIRASGSQVTPDQVKRDGVIINDQSPTDSDLDTAMENSLNDKVNSDEEGLNAEVGIPSR